MPPEDKSSLDKLQERLYEPNQDLTFKPPTVSVNHTPPAAEPWQSFSQRPGKPGKPQKPRTRISLAVWFLIASFVFAIVAVGVTTFFLLIGARAVSNNNIDITISGPTTIASGTAVPLTVTIKNHNPASLVNANLELDFPAGTRSADDITEPLVRYTNSIGSIAAGGTVSQTVQAVLLGSANQTVTIPVTLQYQTPNSNEVLTKQQTYTFTITSSPLSITTQATKSVSPGQPFTVQVTVRSNAASALNDVAVAAEYPVGFMPQSEPGATTTSTFFPLGTLQPGAQETFTIAGALSGSNNNQSDFAFTVGTAKTDGSNQLDLAYASADSAVTLATPFLAASLALNNASDNPLVITRSQAIAGALTWANTLTSGLSNAQVTVGLSGNAYDPMKVTTSNGYYDSAHAQIVFNGTTAPTLEQMAAGASGQGSFNLSLKSGNAFSALRQPTITLSVGIAGTPSGASAPETIDSTFTRTVEISTDLALSSELLRGTGPFTNSGSWPPAPNQATTYTVVLGVTNDVNDVAGATVTMILPTYVTFTGKTTPDDGSLTYDANTQTVTWKLGNVPAGTTKPIVAEFQVSFLPSLSQSGTSPILVESQSLTGVDRFTGATVGNTAPELTTESVSDPDYTAQDGTVASQ